MIDGKYMQYVNAIVLTSIHSTSLQRTVHRVLSKLCLFSWQDRQKSMNEFSVLWRSFATLSEDHKIMT